LITTSGHAALRADHADLSAKRSLRNLTAVASAGVTSLCLTPGAAPPGPCPEAAQGSGSTSIEAFDGVICCSYRGKGRRGPGGSIADRMITT
jgi:hypothetical protein